MDPIISHCLGWFKKPRNSSFNLVMAIWVRNRRSLLIDFLRGISQAGWWLKKNILKKNSQLGCFSHTHRMYAIYGNMDPINIPPMLAYIYQHRPDPSWDIFWKHKNHQPAKRLVNKNAPVPTQPNNNTQFLRIPLEMIAPRESACICLSVCMYVSI